MWKVLRRKEKKINPEIEKAQQDLAEMDAIAKKEERIRRQLSARLTALQLEVDNLTRREGNIASH